jgi:hypothetical protein
MGRNVVEQQKCRKEIKYEKAAAEYHRAAFVDEKGKIKSLHSTAKDKAERMTFVRKDYLLKQAENDMANLQ